MKLELLAENPRIELYEGDCLEILPTFPDKSFDLVLTDPPYGIKKENAEWDKKYPSGFEKDCLRIAETIAIMCGQWAIPDCIFQVKDEYLSILCLENRNGMTYSPIGFGNWIPVILAGKRPPSGRDLLSFSIKGKKNEHPSPKPIEAIRLLLYRLTERLISYSVLDPFAGSGTTGVAAYNLNHNCTMIELEPKYCDIIRRRIDILARQDRLFQ